MQVNKSGEKVCNFTSFCLIAKWFDKTNRSDLRIQVDTADLSFVLFMEEIYVVYRAPYA